MSVTRLPHKLGDLSSDPQKPQTKPGMVVCTPGLGEGSQRQVNHCDLLAGQSRFNEIFLMLRMGVGRGGALAIHSFIHSSIPEALIAACYAMLSITRVLLGSLVPLTQLSLVILS